MAQVETVQKIYVVSSGAPDENIGHVRDIAMGILYYFLLY